MTVLGIETSCDETSAAVVVDGRVASNVISSQYVHQKYGGVVPELASRAHLRLIIQVVEEALSRAGVGRPEIDAVVATCGPGLAGALLVGLSFGKALAYGLGKPFLGVNHMEGHLYSTLLGSAPHGYPFLSLIVSGGHTMLVDVEAPFRHTVLGQTRDDAAGEAFDKVAKMLGLGYPGGPIIDRRAQEGNPRGVPFPRAFLGNGYEFSFSGIKTSVLYHLRRHHLPDPALAGTASYEQTINDICASFQEAVVDVLVAKTIAGATAHGRFDIAIAGGVSANSRLRRRLEEAAGPVGRHVHTPPPDYCMDNGAMIAYVGWMRLTTGETSSMDLPALPNLELH
jgi:N6-L-threonylcarbamoyladenine synthase